MMKHTPGPWLPDPTGDIGWWIIGTSDWPVCEVTVGGKELQVSKRESIGNAQLIAAAPDMKDTLLSVRKHLERECQAGSGPHDLLRKVSAALAKSEGR